MFDTPILFLVYKRSHSTLQVFEEIRKIKPRQLFVVADGPKSILERELCQKTRDVIEKVDWACEVQTLFRENNIGCKYSVSSGINWFFNHVDEGIILEDDCVPNESFFFFCAALLERYRDNLKIMHISGTNLDNSTGNDDTTYHFSNYPNVWGWATWKRAWAHYDLELEDSEFYYHLIKKKIKDPFELRFWKTVLRTLHNLNTWDYQWIFAIWKANGLCVNANYNFVLNIGFDELATHTTYSSPYITLGTKKITSLVHPKKIEVNKKSEAAFLKNGHNLKRGSYLRYFYFRAGNLIHKIKIFTRPKA
jgi:hypothetical protein